MKKAMTTAAMCVALLVASGAGAEARKVMGMTVFSGMLVATVIGVLLVPALYVIIERYVARPKPVEGEPGAANTGGGQAAPGVAARTEEP